METITPVSAINDPLPGGASMTIDSRPQRHLDRLFSKVVYLRKQIKLLDEERDALNDFYRHGKRAREREKERESNRF